MVLQKEVIALEIEKSRIEREKAKIALDKSIVLYFVFMIVGVVGFSFNYLDSVLLNALVIAGIFILIIGTIPYLIIVSKEEKKIAGFLEQLKGKK